MRSIVIRKKFTINGVAHMVRNCSSHRCKHSMHAHTYDIEVYVATRGGGIDLDNGQMVYDFGLFTGNIKNFIKSFERTYVLWQHEFDHVKEFVKDNMNRWIVMKDSPSAESLSNMFLMCLSNILYRTDKNNGEQDIYIKKVRVHETRSGWAECERDESPMYAEDMIVDTNIPEMQIFLDEQECGVRHVNDKPEQQIIWRVQNGDTTQTDIDNTMEDEIMVGSLIEDETMEDVIAKEKFEPEHSLTKKDCIGENTGIKEYVLYGKMYACNSRLWPITINDANKNDFNIVIVNGKLKLDGTYGHQNGIYWQTGYYFINDLYTNLDTGETAILIIDDLSLEVLECIMNFNEYNLKYNKSVAIFKSAEIEGGGIGRYLKTNIHSHRKATITPRVDSLILFEDKIDIKLKDTPRELIEE